MDITMDDVVSAIGSGLTGAALYGACVTGIRIARQAELRKNAQLATLQLTLHKCETEESRTEMNAVVAAFKKVESSSIWSLADDYNAAQVLLGKWMVRHLKA